MTLSRKHVFHVLVYVLGAVLFSLVYPGLLNVTASAQDPDTTPPIIDVWYGSHQAFGQLGTPQEWVNILGNVSDAESGVDSLTYALNGNPGSPPLSIGPDERRLLAPGDFNIELDKDSLIDGLNTIVLTATDNIGNQSTETVTFDYDSSNTWPLPYSIDWSATSAMTEAVQIVDGLWSANTNGIRTQQVGYDRVIAIGDLSWADYQVTVPVTIHDIDESSYGSSISLGPGLGVNLRWPGHSNDPIVCLQPHCGWEPTGGSNWYEWKESEPDNLKITAEPGSGASSTTGLQFEAGRTYWFKSRVDTKTTGSLYSLKVWEDGGSEPADWTLQRQTETGNLANGSFLLVAHHVDATFGDVSVVPLEITHTLTVTTVGSGSVTVDPEQDEYSDGQVVTLTATADADWVFSGWSGDLSGSTNPATLVLTSDKVVTATFVEAISYTLAVNKVGNGTVAVDPDQSEYLYGTPVTLTATPDPGWVFSGWSGDLSGSLSPITLSMTADKTVTATFSAIPATTIVSDDFNTCSLDSGLWTFTDPLADATLTMTGTHALISVPYGQSHSIWGDTGPDFANHAPRIMQPAADTNFVIEAKFDSGVSERFQTQGMLVEQDPNDLLRLEFLGQGSKPYIFVAKIENGVASDVGGWGLEIAGSDVSPLYMRVSRVGDEWTVSYSFDGSSWQEYVTFTHAMSVTAVGVYAGNEGTSSSNAPAHTAVIDYFFNTASPIVPEDADVKTVTVTHVGSGDVLIDPDQSAYTCGDEVELTAVADIHWSFDHWSGDLTGSANPATLIISGDHLVTANFVADTFTLTVNEVGNGDVSAEPASPYTYGQEVTLTATADPGWVFSGWSGDLSGLSNPATLAMTGDKVVTATFIEAVSHNLTVNTLGNGAVAVDPDQSEYLYGTPVTLTATADTDWYFTGWSGDLSGSANPATLWMTGNKAVTATFASDIIFSDDFNACLLDRGVWTFTDPLADATLSMTGTHALISVPAGQAHSTWGVTGPDFANNVPRIMQPAADTDFVLEVKFDSGVSQAYQTQGVLVEQDPNDLLRLEFLGQNSKPYIFVAKIEGGVASNVGGWGLEIASSDVSPLYMRVSRSGDEWTVSYSFDGSSWQEYVTFTHAMSVTAVGVYAGNDEVTPGTAPAHTAVVDYFFNTASPIVPEDGDVVNTLTVTHVGSGSVVIDPDQAAYLCGDVVELTAIPGTHWSFDNWSGDLVSSNNPATLIISGDNVVTATFVEDTFVLTVNKIGNGDVDVDPPGPYTYDQVVTLTATPDPGWSFSGWSGAVSGSTNPITVTMNDNQSVTATFSEGTTLDKFIFLPFVVKNAGP